MSDRPANTKQAAPVPDCLEEMLFALTRQPLALLPVIGLDQWISEVTLLISRLPKTTRKQAWISLIARGLAAGDPRQEGIVRAILIDRVVTAGEAYLQWREAHAPIPEEPAR